MSMWWRTWIRSRWTVAYLVIGALLLIAAGIVGISDNPPGIALAYLGVAALVLSFIHQWRERRRFLWLLVGSVIGFVVFVVVHNFGYGLAQAVEFGPGRWLLTVVEVTAFLLAVLVCPVTFVLGALGWLTTLRKS